MVMKQIPQIREYEQGDDGWTTVTLGEEGKPESFTFFAFQCNTCGQHFPRKSEECPKCGDVKGV